MTGRLYGLLLSQTQPLGLGTKTTVGVCVERSTNGITVENVRGDGGIGSW